MVARMVFVNQAPGQIGSAGKVTVGAMGFNQDGPK
jgi:hypothetical protein